MNPSDTIKRTAEQLAERVRARQDEAERLHGGRCWACREDTQDFIEAAGLSKVEPVQPGPCPLRHFIGHVSLSFRLASNLPARRAAAIERRLWAQFPGARDDVKGAA